MIISKCHQYKNSVNGGLTLSSFPSKALKSSMFLFLKTHSSSSGQCTGKQNSWVFTDWQEPREGSEQKGCELTQVITGSLWLSEGKGR